MDKITPKSDVLKANLALDAAFPAAHPKGP